MHSGDLGIMFGDFEDIGKSLQVHQFFDDSGDFPRNGQVRAYALRVVTCRSSGAVNTLFADMQDWTTTKTHNCRLRKVAMPTKLHRKDFKKATKLQDWKD